MKRRLTHLTIGLILLALRCGAGEIHDAAAKGDVARVKALLAKDKLLVHAKDYAFRQTPLHVAASAGQVDVARVLIAANADLEADSESGERPIFSALMPLDASDKFQSMIIKAEAGGAPLDFAEAARLSGISAGSENEGARSGRMQILQLLMERGAKTEWGDLTLLHEAAVVSDSAFVSILLDKGLRVNARDGGGRTPLHIAAMAGNKPVAKALLDRGADIDPLDRASQTPLHLAALGGQLAVVDLLIGSQAIVDAQRADGRTALHIAAAAKNAAVALRLMEAGADVGVTDKEGWTPLHSACSSGSKEIVEALLARSVSIEAIDRAGFTPLMSAIENGHMEIAELLLAKGANPKVRVKDGRTALHFVCGLPAKPEWIEKLIALGLEVEARDDKGSTPLMVAAIRARARSVETLLRHGADVNETSPNANTPLLLAADMGRSQRPGPRAAATLEDYEAVCELLIQRGARVDAKNKIGFTLLHGAAEGGSLALVRLSLKNGLGVNSAGPNGLTPLHLAAQEGHAEVAEFLLQNGAHVDALEAEGQTPLHFAAWKSPKPEIFDLLKKHGANLNAHCTAYRRTPLTQAATFANVIAVRRLLALGADPNEPDADGSTPLHMAVHVTDVVELKNALLGKDAPANKAAFNALKIDARSASIAKAVRAKALTTDLPARHLEITRLLLEAGASPSAKAKDGHTPLDIAGQLELGTPAIVRLLKNPPSLAKKKPIKQ